MVWFAFLFLAERNRGSSGREEHAQPSEWANDQASTETHTLAYLRTHTHSLTHSHIQHTCAMEVLSNVLGIDCKSLADANSDAADGVDPVESYLLHSKTRSAQVNPSLLGELGSLQEKHAQVQKTLADVIPPLEEYLSNFGQQLVHLTQDLNFIKGKSSELNTLLKENSAKLADISPVVNDLVIPPQVVEGILRGKINSEWTDNITFIKDKQLIYEKYKHSTQVPSDFPQLVRTLELLQVVVLERSKKFIVTRIKSLRDHHTVPSQAIQKQLLDVPEIFQYIAEHNLSLALELRQAYTYTMKWYYGQYFSRYIRSLTIMQFVTIDQNYALGNGLSKTPVGGANGYALSSYLLGGYSKSVLHSAAVATDESVNDYFQIHKRMSVLTQEDNTVMVSQIAENNHGQNFLETGFKNLNLAILDNCTVEFMFLNDFFQVPSAHGSSNIEELRGVLEQIFQQTFESAMEYTRRLIASTFDIFGVLISIRIAHFLQFEAQRRKIPIVDDHLDGQLILLWPKFQQLVDFQCESLRKVAITTSVARFPGGSGDPLATPHELTVQFSKFLTSILTLSVTHKELIDERSEPLYNSITRIRNDFETVMTKCSKKTKSPEKFLAINYMYLYNALQQQDASASNGSFDGDSPETTPLIIQETRSHLKGLVEAFSRVS